MLWEKLFVNLIAHNILVRKVSFKKASEMYVPETIVEATEKEQEKPKSVHEWFEKNHKRKAARKKIAVIYIHLIFGVSKREFLLKYKVDKWPSF